MCILRHSHAYASVGLPFVSVGVCGSSLTIIEKDDSRASLRGASSGEAPLIARVSSPGVYEVDRQKAFQR